MKKNNKSNKNNNRMRQSQIVDDKSSSNSANLEGDVFVYSGTVSLISYSKSVYPFSIFIYQCSELILT